MKKETEEEDGMGSRNKADGEEKSAAFSKNGLETKQSPNRRLGMYPKEEDWESTWYFNQVKNCIQEMLVSLRISLKA